MKTSLTAAFLLMLSSTVTPGWSDTGQEVGIQIKLSANTLAEFRATGGFVRPTLPRIRGIRILKDGSVVGYEGNNEDSLRESQPIAHLSAETVAKLQMAVDSIFRVESLTPKNPHAPGCADAPSTATTVQRSDGEVITYHEMIRCIDFTQAHGNSFPPLDELLNGFVNLQLWVL